MDRLKRARTPLRSAITRTINEAENELANPHCDATILEVKLAKINDLEQRITIIDQEIVDKYLDIVLAAGQNDDELEAEVAANEEIRDKIRLIQNKINRKLISIAGNNDAQAIPDPVVNDQRKSYKLPKVKIREFSGEVLDWLPWWNQFERIHEDVQLHAADKFQYLTQAMKPKSKAADLIKVYPQTAANYPSAIKALKDRFGIPKILKRVYVRELLKMIHRNSRENTTVSSIYDTLEAHLKALESLGVSPDQMDVILFPMVESCLPEDILMAWQRSPNYGREDKEADPPKTEFDYLMEFVKKEVENENQREMARAGFTQKKEKSERHQQRREVATASSLANINGMHCLFCDKTNHEPLDCFKAKKMSLEERKELVMKKNHCFKCLKKGHRASICRGKVSCSLCKGSHHQVLCQENGNGAEQKKVPEAETIHVNSNSSLITRGATVLMKTVHVKIRGSNGNFRRLRLLFDEGSQRSYLKTSVAEELGCKVIQEIFLGHNLFGGVATKPSFKKCYEVQLEALQNYRGKQQVRLIQGDTLCAGCPTIPNGSWIEELASKNIELTDTWSELSEVEILIGSDLWGKMWTGRMMMLKCGLFAMESIFGWTLSGEIPERFLPSCATSIVAMSITGDRSIQDMWSLEAIGIRDTAESISQEEHDHRVKTEMQRSISREGDGRYTIKLPWVNRSTVLPTNRKIAESRLMKATAKLIHQDQYQVYNKIFVDWEREGIIENHGKDTDDGHYLPHRPVFKPGSLTTPVRPVFDASCRTGKHPSLNQCLEKGPNMLELIPSILLRFRRQKIGITADIRKAFQMIRVEAEDRNYQKFLWWEDPEQKKIKVYRYCRVVFGLNCSPFILAAVLDNHLNQLAPENPLLVQKIKKSLYVDNIVTSVDKEEEFEEFKSKSIQAFEEAKMELRYWERSSEDSREDCPTNVLGLKWRKEVDTLSCHVPEVDHEIAVTKRKVLSIVSQVFDPIGFTCPVTLQPKIMIQDSWAESMDWDKTWDKKQADKFHKWIEELTMLGDIRLPRYFGGISREIELHTFCDASQKAYAAVVFARVQGSSGVQVHLLLAKSRLAPLDKKKKRSVTIPRLELMGCTIGARLTQTTIESLEIPDVPSYYWSDSSIALAWVKRDEDWGTFVGNRVREINRLTRPTQWRYVPGSLNPADLPSRGCSPSELLESTWWEGPAWLRSDKINWPRETPKVNEEEVLRERKKTFITSAATLIKEPKFSSYMKNVRVFTWIRRFINNSRMKINQRNNKPFLSLQELIIGEKDAIKESQSRNLQKLQELKKPQVVVDNEGILRVKSRLNRLKDKELFISPIVLLSNDILVNQLIEYVHRAHGHAGTQFVLGKLREKYWILKGRRTVSGVIHRCVTCRRHNTKNLTSQPTDLPVKRIQQQYAFQTTGVDLAGPILLKGGKKAWIILYTCAVYRGVYLDITDSLSTEEFIDSLEKFTMTVGRPSTIYSDNGTNFVGTEKLLKKVDIKKLHVNKINWIFNPPTAAWWGGWWERLVRTLKELLRKMIGTAKLIRKELDKCLSSIAYTINNRPLTTLNEDPEDLAPLTPAMFMRDLPVAGLPEGEQMHAGHLRENYQKIRSLRQALNNRFRKEYLSQLVHVKNEKKSKPPAVGDVVLVGSNDRKRFEWPLGRILEVYPGKDNQVRVAKIKTSNGILVRPVQRLYPLEVTNPQLIDSEKKILSHVQMDGDNQENDQLPIPEMKTRYGRTVKPPTRYTSWNQ